MSKIAYLQDRGVVELSGADRVSFLQGLVSNDVTRAAPGAALWAALLTPQGKWLADFFIIATEDALLLDCERAQAPMLIRQLGRYRLRAKVTLNDASEAYFVHVAWDGEPEAPALMARDPRLPEAGFRVLASEMLHCNSSPDDWHAHRIGLGLPDGSRDLEAEKSILLEAGFDELGGVSWTKGCYMGQELTARTKYRGLVKRRVVPVRVHGPMPEPGATITRDGVEVGVMRSTASGHALALLRLDALTPGEALMSGNAVIVAQPPAWMDLKGAA